MLNGSYGKFGSKWSFLYSPDLMLQVTLTGQLALLMLIERVTTAGGDVISANTDGIVIRARRGLEASINKTIAAWEEITGFVTEETRYSALYSRDVNSFIALREDGKGFKVKGAYAPAEPVGSSWPNPHNQVCIDAVIAYLRHGTPVEETIRRCADIRKFLSVRTVKGGAVKDDRYIGKALRWYYSTLAEGTINYAINGYKVPRTEGAWPLMELPDALPEDIDYGWYVREAESILIDIGERLA